jgi:hypothetical protein
MSWIDTVEQYLLPCPSKYFLGMDCPGCGMQRALLELLRGNFAASLKIYPALLPIIFTFALLALHLKYKFTHGARTLQYAFMFSALVVVTSYIIKQVQFFNP